MIILLKDSLKQWMQASINNNNRNGMNYKFTTGLFLDQDAIELKSFEKCVCKKTSSVGLNP